MLDSYITGAPSIADTALIHGALKALDEKQKQVIDLAVEAIPRRSMITATYGASILLAGAAEPLAGMKSLKVHNCGEVLAWLGASSSSAIHEGGIALEPGAWIEFKSSAAGGTFPKIYARSAGYSTLLEVVEA